MTFHLPESVHRYCTEPRIASAVDILLSGKAPKIPDRLGWDELDAFYRACLAAQQTRLEWAIVMNSLWNAVFADQIGVWRPSSIDQQAEESETRLDAGYLWTEGEFTRDLSRGSFSLQLQIEFDSREGVRANALLWKSGKPLEVPLPDGMEMVGSWTCSPWLPIGASNELDMEAIRSHARQAIDIADSAVGSSAD